MRTISRLVAGVAVAGVLTACGTSGPAGGGGNSNGTGAIQVWALQDTALNPIEKASVDRFSTGGAKATLQTFGNDPYKEKLRIAIGSPNAPDIFFNWGGGNLKEYVDAGRVTDLTPLLEANPALKAAFIPSVLDGAKINGKYYGLPMRGVQPVVLFYNKKVFADAGAQPPKTWDDLLALVETFKGRGITPLSLAGSQAWTELMYAEYLLDRIGGPEVFRAIRDGKPDAWKDPAVLAAMTSIRTLVDKGAFGTKFASVGYDIGGASTLLAQGKSAMHLMGSWEYVNQLGQSPKFVQAGDLGWTTFPTIPNGKGDPANVVGNASNFYSITTSSKAPKTAEEYVKTALTDPTYIDALVKAGDVPGVSGIETKLAGADNADYTQYIYKLTVAAPSFALSWDQDLPAAQATKMLTQLQKVFLGTQTPQGFVDVMSAG